MLPRHEPILAPTVDAVASLRTVLSGRPRAPLKGSAREAYTRREEEHREALERISRDIDRIVTGRVVTFLAALAALVLWDLFDGTAARVSLGFSVALLCGFLALVLVHRRRREEGRRHALLLQLARDGLHRLERRWNELPKWSEAPPAAFGSDHPYASDLDLFGRASLCALCGPVTTASGRSTLATWLLHPASPDELLARQGAAQELASRLDDRLALAALAGRLDPPTASDTDALVRWAEEPPWLLPRSWVRAAMWVLPTAFIGLALLQLTRGGGAFWLLPLVLQLVVQRRFVGTVAADFDSAEGAARSLEAYARQIRLVRGWSVESPRLASLLGTLAQSGASSDERLRKLAKVVEFAESRRNAFFRLGALLLLLDLHVHRALERWKAESGPKLRAWLEALGQVEALAAFGSLAHDHPEWCFPTPSHEPQLSARALAHPLLPPATAVPNDVRVGPPGTFLLVTGSNMSGKSTLLRALGMNVVLASAGGPVCAAELRLPAVALHTSIRVQDSLEEGISLFMAELLTLSRIVAAARSAAATETPVLYLLDEVLQGTNSGDRRVAARTVLRHLLEAGAIGAVTTHDLSLAAAPDLEARAVPVHFSETAVAGTDGPGLSFDYLLKPGLATTRNALTLLEMVGLGPVQDV
jgi:hypothetical protein